jgi:hypothetical protein
MADILSLHSSLWSETFNDHLSFSTEQKPVAALYKACNHPLIRSFLFFTFHQPTVHKSNISHPSQLNIVIMTAGNGETQTQDASTLRPSRVSRHQSPGNSRFDQITEACPGEKQSHFWRRSSRQQLIRDTVRDERWGHGEPLLPGEDDSVNEQDISQATLHGIVLAPMLSVAELEEISKSYGKPPPSVMNGMSQSYTRLRMVIADQI